ncbi:MAG: MtnX-like HAD-IB family phosphatase [Chloroflexi bacterium]|nr:MtnX-like HAD-IB family phosphatase [Chloroflexota bacterium]
MPPSQDIPILVQCDFDDTITVGNVSDAVREEFYPGDWRSMEEEYVAGMYSVEESNIRQFGLIAADQDAIEEFVVGDVVVRYAFDEFVDYCHGVGIRLVVVSSGLDLYIRPVMRQLGLDDLEVFSGHAEVRPDGIMVEYTDASGTSITSGFKESYVRHFRSQGHTVVCIGDGLSDVVPALESDFVIARSTLGDRLTERGVSHFTFETFNDVGAHLEEIRLQLNS